MPATISAPPARLATVTAMRFTLRQLEYFVATCEAGSVTEAAQCIPVSQSSVSAAVAQLELALGVRLLIRHHAQGVSPTPEGRQFLVRARELLRQADDLERFASELTHDLSGVLEVGCLLTLAPLVMPRLCQDFRAQHPAVAVELVEAGHDDLLSALRSGKISLALTYDYVIEPDIVFDELVALPPYAMFAADHPLAQRASVGIEELQSEPFVLLDLPYSREYFFSLFLAHGGEPLIVQRSTQPEVIRTLVGNGYGYTIVNARPRMERALDGQPLAAVPIAGDPRPMIMGMARLVGMRQTRLATAFLEHCRRSIAPSGVPGLHAGAQ